MTDLPDLSAVELLTLYRDRRASPVEVMTAVLARVDAAEPLLNATWALDPDAAFSDARASEARWVRGEPMGALDGVPVTIKELIATRGVASLAPVASNAADAGRARNRRVELVAQ